MQLQDIILVYPMRTSYPNSSTAIEASDTEANDYAAYTERQRESPWLSRKKVSKGQLLLLIILNICAWGGAYLYLKWATPVYQSSWGVIVLGTDASQAEVQLPDAGRASASSSGSRTKSFEDARADYIYIAESTEVIQKAAEISNVNEAEFRAPEITADDGSSIISFKQTAESPELAHRKSTAYYAALNDYLDELRQSSQYQQKSQNNKLLQEARAKVSASQSQLAKYRAKSSFESDSQLEDLATGIEELRRIRSDYSVQASGLTERLNELNLETKNLNQQDTSDAYKLKGDQIYQQQLSEYSRLKTEFSRLSADLSPQHPLALKTKEELENAEASLKRRSTTLLGRLVAIDSLTTMESLINDPQVNVLYDDFYKEATANRIDREKLMTQSIKLDDEIRQMETRLRQLSQDKLVVDRLKRELQVAEAVLASKVATLDLDEEDIFSIYPPIKLVREPTVPDESKPIAPNVRMVLLTALAGSFILSMGILLFVQNEPQKLGNLPLTE